MQTKTIFRATSYRGAVEQEQAAAWRAEYQRNVKRYPPTGPHNRNHIATIYGMNGPTFRWAYGMEMDVDFGTVGV